MLEGDTTTTPTPGLRQTRTRHTRATIQATALRLAAERGYDNTTIDDVATAAGVSRRTVFNYFPTKADMFIIGPHTPEQKDINTFITSRGPLLDDLATLLATTVPTTGTFFTHADDFERLKTVLRDNPTLVPELQQRVRLHTSVIRAAIAQRLGTNLTDPRVTAASALSTSLFKGALDLWTDKPHGCAADTNEQNPANKETGSQTTQAEQHTPISLADAINTITTSLKELLAP